MNLACCAKQGLCEASTCKGTLYKQRFAGNASHAIPNSHQGRVKSKGAELACEFSVKRFNLGPAWCFASTGRGIPWHATLRTQAPKLAWHQGHARNSLALCKATRAKEFRKGCVGMNSHASNHRNLHCVPCVLAKHQAGPEFIHWCEFKPRNSV